MNTYRLVWSPTGQTIGTVQAKTMRAAIRKAPKPYSKYKGEIYAEKQNPVGLRVPLRRNAGPGDLPYGEWIPAHAVRFNGDGSTSLMTERGSRLPNITLEGFTRGGHFHPIRWDPAYDPDEAGEQSEYNIDPPAGWYPGQYRKKQLAKKRRRRRR